MSDSDEAIETEDRREFAEGERVGRFVVLRDQEGQLHAVAAGSVGAVCQTDEGTLLMLPGGRLLHAPASMRRILGWLDGRGPR